LCSRATNTEPVDRPSDVCVRAVRETLEACVVSHCMTDVGLGAFLSGGLDSSIIAALAKRHLGELQTFSVGVAGSSDLAAARVVAEHLGTIHYEYEITAGAVLDALPEIIHSLESYDQDLVRSAVPCYFAARLAAKHTKVILTGEGADELFAGYTYHRSFTDPKTLHAELRRTITTLHDINLQRADRITMLHSIEGRVPFLDLRMVDLAQQIPVSLKLFGNPVVEKWVLREAFKHMLPESIVWRRKEQFDEGSGTAELLPKMLGTLMTEADAVEYRLRYPEVVLRSAEECQYHRVLVASYTRPNVVLNNVARWAGDRLYT
jgi:asparagine synthase (glutamine-hydrolysing)